jgi:hypothetical protein
VPYTGATSLVNLGIYNLKANSLYAEGDGSFTGGGLLIKQYVSGTTSITGYNTISSQTSGFFFSASQGGSYKNFLFDATSLTDLTVRSYTLPNASGTLALTSDLGAYLPLSGGTLTGALTGTSATFSGDLTIDTNTLFVDSTNNRVGIGTTSPALRFNVNSGGTSGNSFSAVFSDNTTNQNAIAFSHFDNNSRIYATFLAGAGSDQSLSFWTTLSNSAQFERMRITSGGNVGIGTTSPSNLLDVVKSGTNAIRVQNTANTSDAYFIAQNTGGSAFFGINATGPYIYTATALDFTLLTNNTERLRILSTGQLVKGGDSTSARIIPGVDNVGYVGDSGNRWQAIYAVNGTIQTSDGREKTDINNSDLGLDFITKLRPVSYKWIVGENLVTEEKVTDKNGEIKTETIVTPRAGIRTHYGFIAQEIEELLDGKDFGGFIYDKENDKYSLRYSEFISPMIKSIQELTSLVKEQQAQIEELKALINK